ncbi:MAG: flagellar biosynthesis anti-sigma factor FlgM [Planctomycetaceae bacterium]|nr:flagellar biosynthesis anti-sigma factor FlgM [Planctomycetaceae bacterium]
MQVNGPSPSNSYNQIQPLRGPVKPAHFHKLAATRAAESGDQLTISAEAMAKIESTNAASAELRANKIAEIRAQLAAGTYETPEKLDVAVDRMLQRIS